MTTDILIYILGICIAIIGFFLKSLHSDIKTMQVKLQDNHTDVEVLKAGHNDIMKSLSEIKLDVKDLIKNINKN